MKTKNTTIRLSDDIIEFYKAEGKRMGVGYQTAIKIVLSDVMTTASDHEAVAKFRARKSKTK